MKKKESKIKLTENNIIIPSEIVAPGDVLAPTDALLWKDYFYNIKLLDMNQKEVDFGTVYLYDKYFYPYEGLWQNASMDTRPGIYWDRERRCIVRLDPHTEDEKEEYSYAGKIIRSDLGAVRSVINSGQVNIQNMPDNSKAFITPIRPSDDILKRLIKQALLDKDVNIDMYRQRFVDKNALFNFKQVLKGDNRLSMLLFDRGTTALNLKYTIILEEKDPTNSWGKPLTRKLIATSEDTFDMGVRSVVSPEIEMQESKEGPSPLTAPEKAEEKKAEKVEDVKKEESKKDEPIMKIRRIKVK